MHLVYVINITRMIHNVYHSTVYYNDFQYCGYITSISIRIKACKSPRKVIFHYVLHGVYSQVQPITVCSLVRYKHQYVCTQFIQYWDGNALVFPHKSSYNVRLEPNSRHTIFITNNYQKIPVTMAIFKNR